MARFIKAFGVLVLWSACGLPAEAPAPFHRVTYGGKPAVLVRPAALDAAHSAQLSHLKTRLPGHALTPWKLGEATVFSSGRMYLKLAPSVGPTQRQELVDKLAPLRTQRLGPLGEHWDMGARLFETLEAAAHDPRISVAEPELAFEVKQHWQPNDPLFHRQWHLESTGQEGAVPQAGINAPAAWDVTRGSPDVMVAIIDDGVELAHRDFDPCRMVAGPDVYSGDDDPNPGRLGQHGTSCAGVAAAGANNHTGGSGICPECRVMAIRLLGTPDDPENLQQLFETGGYVFDTWAAQAFLAAVEAGASVLSNSWGPGREVAALATVAKDAMDHALTAGRGGLGTVVVFAAGNSDRDMYGDGYAAYPPVVAVSALDDQGVLASYSCYGAAIDVTAPSSGQPGYDESKTTGIWTTDRTGALGYNTGTVLQGDRAGHYTNAFGGTSSAAPLVAGTLGLMFSVDPTLTGEQAVAILKETAFRVDEAGGAYDPSGHSNKYGHGRIDAAAAVLAVQARRTAASVGVPCTTGCAPTFTCEPGGRFEAYCTHACSADTDCPSGYACAASAEGGALVCVRNSTCPAQTELCGDGVDNNANDQVDEGCPTACAGQTAEGVCNGAQWSACEDGQTVGSVCNVEAGGCGFTTTGFAACLGCADVVDGTRACRGNVLQECRGGVLAETTCPETCSETGPYGPGCSCLDGLDEFRCTPDGHLQVCAEGVTLEVPCAGGCSESEGCLCGDVPSDAPVCRNNALVMCNIFSGTTVDLGCQAGCENDACVCPGGLQPGSPVCREGARQECDSQTGGVVTTRCAWGCNPDGLTCACEPALQFESACRDGHLARCDPYTGNTLVVECSGGCEVDEFAGARCICGAQRCEGTALLQCDPYTGEEQWLNCVTDCEETDGGAQCACPQGEGYRCDQGALTACSPEYGPYSWTCPTGSCGWDDSLLAACPCQDSTLGGECVGSTLRFCDWGNTVETTCANGCALDALGFARCQRACGITPASAAQACEQGRVQVCSRDTYYSGGSEMVDCAAVNMECAMGDAGPHCVAPDGGAFWAGGVVHGADAGPQWDAALPVWDGGVEGDAGATRDAGVVRDAGAADSGAAANQGGAPAPDERRGLLGLCSCTWGKPGGVPWWVGLLLLGAFRRRRH